VSVKFSYMLLKGLSDFCAVLYFHVYLFRVPDSAKKLARSAERWQEMCLFTDSKLQESRTNFTSRSMCAGANVHNGFSVVDRTSV